MNDNDYTKMITYLSNYAKMITILSGVVFGLIGLGTIIFAITKLVTNFKKKRKYVLTEAKVVDYVTRGNGKKKMYGIVLEYVVDGIDYSMYPKTYSVDEKKKYPLGSTYKIWYNPDDANESVYGFVNFGWVFLLLFGIGFVREAISMLIPLIFY